MSFVTFTQTKQKQNEMKKKIISVVLRIVISLGLVGYFVYSLAGNSGGLSGAFHQFKTALSGATLNWLLPAAFLHFAGISLTSLRWRILLRAQGVNRPYGELFSYYIMAAFFNTFLPSTIGGDALRAMESKKHTENGATSVMVVIVERLTGITALLFISIMGLVFSAFFRGKGETNGTAWILALGGVLFFVLLILLAHPRIAPRWLNLLGKILPVKIHGFLTRAYEAVAIYFHKPGHLLAAQGVSIVFQLVVVVYYYFLTRGLNQDPAILDFLTRMPVIVFLLMVIPAINGIGVRTAGFQELILFPPACALAAETLDLGFRIFYGLFGGLAYLFYKRPGVAEKSKDVES